MRVRNLHEWDLNPKGARMVQDEFRSLVEERPIDLGSVRFVAGCDVSYAAETDRLYAAVVVTSFPELETVEEATAILDASFPYMPGLLAFREAPALSVAFRHLHCQADAVLFDGQGYAHPRRFGIASHMGLLLEVPTVGCAKTLLTGEQGKLAAKKGSKADLVDGSHGSEEVVGAAVRTRANVAPVYVSAGHLSDLESAIALVIATAKRYRIPEPLRRAHQLSGELRTRDLEAREGEEAAGLDAGVDGAEGVGTGG